jgi:hypothetical protein
LVGGITSGIVQDFATWVDGYQGRGTAKWTQDGQKYAASVWNNAQGDPSGRGAYSGFGIGNFPLGTGPYSTPGGAASAVGNDILSALGITGLAKDVLYGITIAGGGIVMLVGLVLIGVDLRGSSLPSFSRVPSKAPEPDEVIQRRQNRQEDETQRRTLRELRIEREQFDREHRASVNAEKLKQERAKTRLAREQARERAARRKRASGEFPKGY